VSEQAEPYSAEDVDVAVAALSEPGRLDHAQQVITHAAPSLQGVLSAALDEGGWFGEAMDRELAQAIGIDDPYARLEAVRRLITEETRLGMLVGATVGFELARELAGRRRGG
jgi:hypothetical protein